MSDELLDWPEEIYDGEDVDDIDVDIYVKPKRLKAARARRKLEILWERKRLADNLHDVLADSVPVQQQRSVRLSLKRPAMTLVQKANKYATPTQRYQRHTGFDQSEVA